MSVFVSAEFEKFLLLNGICHVTSVPYHPASNRQAERAVQTAKKGVDRMQPGPLPDQLTMPHTATGVTPAELLMGRNLQTCFHKLYPDQRKEVEKHQAQQKCDHNNGTELVQLEPGLLVDTQGGVDVPPSRATLDDPAPQGLVDMPQPPTASVDTSPPKESSTEPASPPPWRYPSSDRHPPVGCNFKGEGSVVTGSMEHTYN